MEETFDMFRMQLVNRRAHSTNRVAARRNQ